MFAVDVCDLPETGSSTFVLAAGLLLLVVGVIVTRWVRQSAGRMSVVVAPLVLLGGLVLAPQVANPCAPATTTVAPVTTAAPVTTTAAPATTVAPTTTTTVAPAGTITTSGYAFTPTTLSISVGQSVAFNVNSSHDITWQNGPAGRGATGAPYSRTFSTAGAYAFYCSIHSSMTGTITVS